MFFDREVLTGEGSYGEFRLEGEDHEYDDFVGNKLSTAPPDLLSLIVADEKVLLTEEKSSKAKEACPSEKKSSRVPSNAEIIDLDSITLSNQRPFLGQDKSKSEVAKTEAKSVIMVDDVPFFTIKKEGPEKPFLWRDMGSEIIEVLDSDDEMAVSLRPGLSTMNSKSTKSQTKVSALISSAKGARDSPIDHEKLLGIQKKYIARALEKSMPSGASSGFQGCQPSPDQSATDGKEDQNAWMKSNVDFDADDAAMFVSLVFTRPHTDMPEDLPS